MHDSNQMTSNNSLSFSTKQNLLKHSVFPVASDLFEAIMAHNDLLSLSLCGPNRSRFYHISKLHQFLLIIDKF